MPAVIATVTKIDTYPDHLEVSVRFVDGLNLEIASEIYSVKNDSLSIKKFKLKMQDVCYKLKDALLLSGNINIDDIWEG